MKKSIILILVCLFGVIFTCMAQTRNSSQASTFVLGNGKLGPIQIGKSISQLLKSVTGLYDKFVYKKEVHESDMADKIGNTYDAHISGLTSYGIYAQVDENHCEGMIPIRDLGDDYYDFDEKNFMIVGRRHHTKYQLGDPIRIQVARANLERKQLDFTLADD